MPPHERKVSAGTEMKHGDDLYVCFRVGNASAESNVDEQPMFKESAFFAKGWCVR